MATTRILRVHATDERLPGSGASVCGLYDVSPSAFGRATAGFLVRPVSDFGKHTEVYDGFDLVVQGRFGRGGMVTGGLNTGRTVIDDCVVVDSPQLQYCRNTLPFRGTNAVQSVWGLSVATRIAGQRGVSESARCSYSGKSRVPERRNCSLPRPQPVQLPVGDRRLHSDGVSRADRAEHDLRGPLDAGRRSPHKSISDSSGAAPGNAGCV
jgi:hypothetical protein